jgi:plastocyanin
MKLLASVIIILFAISIGSPLFDEIYAQTAKEVKVSIPKGTSSPGCEVKKSCYKPYETKAKVGSKVTWKNDDTSTHTVTSGKKSTPDKQFDSGLIMPGKSYSNTFKKAGTFDYFCMAHPWMTGKVVVSK